ncbi:hypothetical protein IIC68_02485 [archaeon]|nr:hypothetical protein [archaeon]
MKIAILLGLMVFLLGCTQITTNQNGSVEFELNKAFTVEEGKSYFYSNGDQRFDFSVKEFIDARCPGGDIQCVWAGEQKVVLIVHSLEVEFEISLGETLNPIDGYGGYTIELVSIDIDNGVAELKVTKDPGPETQWFSIEPIQCRNNAWEQWAAENIPSKKQQPEKYIVAQWFEKVHGIEVLDFASREKYEVVCDACDCPRGDEIAVLVNSSNSGKMQELGFTAMGNIACTEDARLCPDGSGVGRQAPFCEFAECPGVTREDNELFIKMFDIPGFVQERTTVVTIIENDGDIIVESTTIDSTTFRGVITEVQKKASEEELQELQDFILSTNFFELTQDDARDCIIDIPTVNLTINLGEESNAINSLGAECDPAKTVEAHEIISKIRELVENAQDVSPKIIDEPIIVKTDSPGYTPIEFYKLTSLPHPCSRLQ